VNDQPRVGVLVLQGDFRKHKESLERIGVTPIDVRRPEHLENVDALIIPGGESTTIAKLLEFTGLHEAILERCEVGTLGVMGTCAGMIVAAERVLDGRPDQKGLGIFDAAVRRNVMGRQKFSFEDELDVKGLDEPFHMVFIRGPGVEEAGEKVEVLAEWDGSPVLCAQGPHLFATFHPELTKDGRIHRLFIERLAS